MFKSSDDLANYYESKLNPKVFIYKLRNNETINLFFNFSSFYHLAGLHHIQKNSGIKAWNDLKTTSIDFNKDTFRSNESKMVLNRIRFFGQLSELLKNPQMYIFKATDFPNMQFNSKYFAVLKQENRYLKLGIAFDNKGDAYPETFLVDLNKEKYNKYIEDKYKIEIIESKIVPKKEFLEDRKLNKIINQYKDVFPPIKYLNKNTLLEIDKINKNAKRILSINEIKKLYRQADMNYNKALTSKKYFKNIVDDLNTANTNYNKEIVKTNKRTVEEVAADDETKNTVPASKDEITIKVVDEPCL